MTIPWGDVLGFLRKETGPAGVAIGAVTGAYLFVPQVGALGPSEWRPFILATFLLGWALAIIRGIDWATAKVAATIKAKRETRTLLGLIRNLNPETKGLLKLFLTKEALRLDGRDANVSMLRALNLTFMGSVSYGGMWFDYTIQPDIRRLLGEHPDVLDGAAKPTAQGRRRDQDD